MAVDINRVLLGGYERLTARTGLLFVLAYFVVSLSNTVLDTDVGEFLPFGDLGPSVTFTLEEAPAPPSLGLPPVADALAWVVLLVVGLVLTVAATRTFVAGEDRRVPREFVTRNVALVALNVLVGGFLFALAVVAGLFLLVVPGLYLLVALFFWEVVVAVEDESFVDGFKRSWELTRDKRLTLFLVGVVVALATFVVGFAFALPAALLPAVPALVLTEFGGAVTTVFTLGAVAETYNQLLDAEGDGTAPAGDGDDENVDAA